MAEGDMPRPQRLLVVCTANAIRSPFVENMLRAGLASAGVPILAIESAGTAARPDLPAEPGARDRARAHGFSLEHHRTRRLDESLLAPGTTVLCAARVHRRVVLDMRPDLISSVFTVREFARYVSTEAGGPAAGATSWSSLVARADAARLRPRPSAEHDDDIVDPVGRDEAVWDRFEREAFAAVSMIVERLARLAPESAEATAGARRSSPRRDYRRSRMSSAPE